jgi:hypothetical protein
MIDLTPEKLGEIIKAGESKTVEFKSRLPPDSVLAKYISAFANSDGGLLLIGIGDKGTILGLSDTDQHRAVERLTRLSKALLSQPVRVEKVEFEGARLVFAMIPSAADEHRPVMTSQGEVFDRFGSAIRKNYLAENLVPKVQPPERLPASRPQIEVRAFVAMSFREEEEPALVDYYRAIQRACVATELPIELCRVDLVEGDYEISQKIMDEIDKCGILIADFTLSPRNVYFELGYARGRSDISIIQTARKDTALEFDIRNWRTLFYKNATELEEKLEAALRDAYQRTIPRPS